MSKYVEMCQAAKTARAEFLSYRQRCWNYFGSVIEGLITHCEVPEDEITYLKWNGGVGEDRRYLRSPEGQIYTLPGAADYDYEDGYWHLGIHIGLTPKNTLPKQYVTFALCVKEQNSNPMVRIGLEGKPQVAHFSNVTARNLFCEMLAEKVVQAFADPQQPTSKAIGFAVSL